MQRASTQRCVTYRREIETTTLSESHGLHGGFFSAWIERSSHLAFSLGSALFMQTVSLRQARAVACQLAAFSTDEVGGAVPIVSTSSSTICRLKHKARSHPSFDSSPQMASSPSDWALREGEKISRHLKWKDQRAVSLFPNVSTLPWSENSMEKDTGRVYSAGLCRLPHFRQGALAMTFRECLLWFLSCVATASKLLEAQKPSASKPQPLSFRSKLHEALNANQHARLVDVLPSSSDSLRRAYLGKWDESSWGEGVLWLLGRTTGEVELHKSFRRP